MAVLLIGSTGNGKSTLGNFLLDPKNAGVKEQFAMARDNSPETQFVQEFSMENPFKGQSKHTPNSLSDLVIIDTPGLNESGPKDFQHMIAVIKMLRAHKTVQACIIVVKFNSKIDAQYKATMQYYSMLLPHLFEKNVVIVMTDFATDTRSIKMREAQKIDVSVVKHNTIKEIVECANLEYKPMIFTIDCLPLDQEESDINYNVRESLLQYILSQNATKVTSLKVAKIADIKTSDNEMIKEYKGQIRGYNERLQEADYDAKEALEKLEKKEEEVTKLSQHLEKLKSELKDKNTEDRIVAMSWWVSEEWKLMLQGQSKQFDMTSPWKISGVQKYTSGRSELKDYEETDKTVKGKIEGKFLRGLYANISVETFKRDRYATKIDELRTLICSEEQKMETLKVERELILNNYKNHKKKLKLLTDFIAGRREKIKRLSSDYLSIEEAEERLEAMK